MTLRYIVTPEERRRKLKKLLESKRLIRGIETHNAISALISNDLKVEVNNSKVNEFDFFWESSLTDSASKGHPDIEIVSFDSRLKTISEILEVTNKPIIVDGDTGGHIHHFEYLIPRLERLGVSAVIVEDKVFPKRNSLEPGAMHLLEDPDNFADKIKIGKKIQKSESFMIIARLESLIAGKGVDDALIRARKYLEAGVDGIMIHSKSSDPKSVFDFAKEYSKLCKELNVKKPLVCVPTTYNSIYESEFEEKGFNVVIYANHMLRASYKAMKEVGKMILTHERSLETDPHISSVKEIFEKVGFLDIKEKDKMLSKSLPIIIPAAGENPVFKNLFGELPRALINICGKTLLEHQMKVLNDLGLDDINVVIGYEKDKFKVGNVSYIENLEYSSKGMFHSLMKAKEKMKKGFIHINSDILFDEKLIKELLERKEDIVLVLDNSYLYHKHDVDKKLDGVITKKGKKDTYQKLRHLNDEIVMIGRHISNERRTHEFIGMSKFSKQGAENLIKIYEDCKSNCVGKFHEAENFGDAHETDMFQEMINRGFKIAVHETNGGWIEIHNEKDLDYAKELLENL